MSLLLKVSHNDMISSLHAYVVLDYRMFPLKRSSEDQSVSTEMSSRPPQTQVAWSGVEQVTGADDHSDTATYAADCAPDTGESLDTSQLQTRLETKQDKLRETHGLGLEIREMMQGMGREIREMRQDIGREMNDMRQDIGREMGEMRRDNGAMRLEICDVQKEMGREMNEMKKEMGREMSELQKVIGREMSMVQKEMSEMQQKVLDNSTTTSHAVISKLTSASGRSTEEDLKDVTTHLTDTGTIVVLSGLLHMLFSINAQIKYNKIKVNGGICNIYVEWEQ